MKILSRYIIKEMGPPFFLGFLVFTFILLFSQLYQLIDLIINKGVGFFTTCWLFFLYLPALLAVTIPLSLLVACLLAFGRLAADNELIAVRASGVGLRKLLIPALLAGLVLSLVMVEFNDTILPAANMAYKNLLYEIIQKRAGVLIQEQTFITGFDGYIFFIGKKDSKTGLLQDIVIYNMGNNKQPLSTIFAKQGRVISDKNTLKVTMELNDGVMHQLGRQQDQGYYNRLFFNTYVINLDVSGILSRAAASRSPREMNRREITALIDQEKKAGKDIKSLQTEYQLKLAIPFACLAFSLIGSPLGSLTRKSGRFMGAAVSLGLIFIYYILLFGGQITGERGILPAWFSIWLPNITFSLLGLFLFLRVAQEKPLIKL